MVRSISKNRIIRGVFSKLAPFYDRLEPSLNSRQATAWRGRAIRRLKALNPHRVLDACAGTGLMTLQLAEAFGPQCHILAVDFCPAMAAFAKQRFRDQHLQRRVEVKVENVEVLPFPEDFFDAVFISFGLRFVSDIRTVLKESFRQLKPEGTLVILELAQPTWWWGKILAQWRREFWLLLRAWFVGRIPAALIHPLHDSLFHYPDPDKLCRMLFRSGFAEAEYVKLGLGSATIHWALKKTSAPQL